MGDANTSRRKRRKRCKPKSISPVPTKLVILTLDGDLKQHGFRVTLDIGLEGIAADPDHSLRREATGSLPPAPQLLDDLQRWQLNYRDAIGQSIVNQNAIEQEAITPTRGLKPRRISYGGSINPVEACQQSTHSVAKQFQEWLRSESFQMVNMRLREGLNREDFIRVVIRTQDLAVAQLPWHRWDLVERYPYADVAFSPLASELLAPLAVNPRPKVKILAILGHSQGIDTDRDRRLLENFPGVEVTVLDNPQRRQINDQLWQQPWDMLFFAGHSESLPETEQSVAQGRLYLNADVSLTLEDLRYGLKKAIANGLQIALFNSCDGLGLAQSLSDLALPQLIVMRERVPDPVAQSFLDYFLQAFSYGQPFHLAIRDARERLQGLEDRYPCASWLPLVYQDPAFVPPTWQELTAVQEPKLSFQATAMISGIVAGVVVAMRLAGWLQPLELKGYDQLMRWRPVQPPDDRILLVTIDETDIGQQSADLRRGTSITDGDLEKLLTVLNHYDPRVVALDLYRDFSVDPSYVHLKHLLETQAQLVTPCQFGRQPPNQGIAPYPELSPQQWSTRVGFTSGSIDEDGILRRALLSRMPPRGSVCPAEYSLAFVTALHYLQQEGMTLEWTDESDRKLSINQVVFSPLKRHSGGYHQALGTGQQILLNYGTGRQPVALTVSLGDVLADRVSPEWIRDRIVLIGNTDPSFKDFHGTPYTRRYSEKMAGVTIQAHTVSQILRTVLDQEPLIRTWSQWGDGLWILAGAMVGGGTIWLFTKQRTQAWGIGLAVVGLTGSCYGALLVGVWLPWIPGAIALTLTPFSTLLYQRFTKFTEQ